MLGILVKIFAFYLLFVAFKALLTPKKGQSKVNGAQGPRPPFGFKSNTKKSQNDDIIEAEYRVIKD